MTRPADAQPPSPAASGPAPSGPAPSGPAPSGGPGSPARPPAQGAPKTLLPFAGLDDPRLDAVSRAFARGDFAAARRGLAQADPTTDAPTHRALRSALRLDPAIPLAGLAFFVLWAVVFFGTV